MVVVMEVAVVVTMIDIVTDANDKSALSKRERERERERVVSLLYWCCYCCLAGRTKKNRQKQDTRHKTQLKYSNFELS